MACRFLYSNIWDSGSVVASSEASGYPVTNTQHRWHLKSWRSATIVSEQIIKAALNSPKSAQAFLVFANNIIPVARGLEWSDLGQQYGQTYILSLAYLGNGIALAGTYPNGKILRSTDYGATWSDLGQQYGQTYILSLAYLGTVSYTHLTLPTNREV